MKSLLCLSTLMILTFSQMKAQEYKAYNYLGLRSSFGTLSNPYTNNALESFEEKMKVTILDFSTEGMDQNFFVRFNVDFFGVIPDYIIKAVNKNNRKLINGALMKEFYDEYNQVEAQYDFNASFSDWDVMGLNLAYGYKYLFAGGNVAWNNTTLKAYQSVTHIKIKEQTPPDFHSFNTKGNFTYGVNLVLSNNNPEKPIRFIWAYDWFLMRDYNTKWRSDLGTRMNFDLQANFPAMLNKDKWGIYGGLNYRMHDINYPLSADAVELTQHFTSSVFSVRAGISW